ncbi:hypothetical protein Tco_0877381 [Tanacetum coccineum]|uniref:Uncharacterized protein n=1 Tax=Tanacetum coccineum TaxID=301880 RepID=A0ABQ5BUY3_9ASTR
MVAYLKKPKGSEAFHQIVDFLNTSHIKTTNDGEVEIIASIDGQVNTIIEASLKRHLKLEDSDVADEVAFTSVDVDAGGAATTNISLEAGQGSGTIHNTPTRPHDSPLPRVHTLGSDEGSLQQNELIDLVTKLTDRIEVLENDMQQKKKVYSSALTKLILRVKKLEKKVKTKKARKRAKIVISEDEDAEEDSSKHGRKISEIDKVPTISLVDPEQDMEYDFDVSTAKEFTIVSVPVTTASASISTVSPPRVSTAEDISGAKTLVYIRRSAEKRKDKGKAIMKEDESVQKKTKKQLEQERLGYEEAIRLQEQINEKEYQRIARDAEIAKHDPDVLRYHALQNRSFSKAEVRKNMCIYLKNQGGYKLSHFKGMSYEDIRPIFERSSKKRSREDSDEDNAKKHKLEDDAEKKELRGSMDVVPRDDISIDVESLPTKYPIVDWKTHVLTKNMMYYQIIRADGSSKNYKVFSEMLDDFDRQDVLDLHRLVYKVSTSAVEECFEESSQKEVMEFESAYSHTTAKLPILKLENGNLWVSIPQTAQENGTLVTKMSVPVAAEEKTNKKNDVKARRLLLMALPNEHQLTFS